MRILGWVKNIFKNAVRTIGFFIFFAGDSGCSKNELNTALYDSPSHKLFIYFNIIFFIGLVVVASIGTFFYQNILNNPTSFNVNAITEEVKVSTLEVPMSRWPVKGIELSKNCPDKESDVELIDFTGNININPFVRITFTRISLGELYVAMYNDTNDSVGDLFDEEDEHAGSLTSCAFFQINNIAKRAELGETFVFPITGEISAGNEVRFLAQNNTPILREGQVTILDRSFLVGENYSIGPFDLDMGDTFEIQKTTVPSQGFVLVNENPAINLVFRGEGFRGVIKRYQSEDYVLQNTFWSKLYNDEALSLVWVFIFIQFNFIRVYLRYLVN